MRPAPLKLLPLCLAISCAVHANEEPVQTWQACASPQSLPEFRPNDPNRGAAQRAGAQSEVSADDYFVDQQDVTIAQGNVVIERADQWIGTDKLTYRHDTQTYETEGGVRYQDDRVRMTADQAKGDDAKGTVELRGAQYQFSERLGNGRAATAKMQGDQGKLSDATYSTCPPGQQEWSFSADSIDVDNAKQRGVARNATLRLGKVPIFWTPYISFPTTDERRSGLLAPTLGFNDENGFDYKQPIYFNLAPNVDATLSPRILSRRGWQLGTELRYLGTRQQGELGGEWLGNDRILGGDRFAWHWRHFASLSSNWYASANVNRVSDARYFNDLGDSLLSVSPNFLTSNVALVGRGEHWRASVAVEDYQTATLLLPPGSEPYARLPRADFLYAKPFGAFEVGIGAETARFEHDALAGGRRWDLRPYVQADFGGDAWFVKSRLSYRMTGYSLDDDWSTALSDLSPSRELPIFSLDAGLHFERDGGSGFVQTLEPRLFYLRVPYRDQSGLPLFDTAVMSFDWPSLFRDNRFAGADRQADANQVTLAVNHRWLESETGRERFQAGIGRILYLDDPRVLLPGELPIENRSSDWVVQAQYRLDDRWTLAASEQWSPRDGTRLRTAALQYRWGQGGVINVAYRFRRDVLEQTDLSAVYPLGPTWSLYGRWNHDLDTDQRLETLFGLQWKSCCVSFRALARDYIRSVDGSRNRGLYLELELNGLGGFGRDTGRLLENAILGYTP